MQTEAELIEVPEITVRKVNYTAVIKGIPCVIYGDTEEEARSNAEAFYRAEKLRIKKQFGGGQEANTGGMSPEHLAKLAEGRRIAAEAKAKAAAGELPEFLKPVIPLERVDTGPAPAQPSGKVIAIMHRGLKLRKRILESELKAFEKKGWVRGGMREAF